MNAISINSTEIRSVINDFVIWNYNKLNPLNKLNEQNRPNSHLFKSLLWQ